MFFENLVALYIAVEKQCTQEIAFQYLDRFAEGKITGKPAFKWSDADVEDIKKFREQGLTCKEISEIYFTTTYAIYWALNKKRAAKAAKIKNLDK